MGSSTSPAPKDERLRSYSASTCDLRCSNSAASWSSSEASAAEARLSASAAAEERLSASAAAFDALDALCRSCSARISSAALACASNFPEPNLPCAASSESRLCVSFSVKGLGTSTPRLPFESGSAT